ncbi:hypothetical protein SAMN05444351_3506 [Geodermatophilus nigrescens]|uniref:Uncharacterized protein n=2 Tax=Geodermatophilus nigrescens TaxID=1070870 RepID=A0A1M5NCP8_9ACTN|nr:hypothetical protein SAMN05444351_3506 [Geodermatophilus nigrescens]
MLCGMESTAPVAAWLVLGLALAGLAAAAVLLARTRPAGRPAQRTAAPAPAQASRWAQDDLPAFLEAPPGTPRPPVAAPPEPPLAGPDDDGDAGRAVAALAAAALALVAVLAGVALAAREDPAPAAAPPPVATAAPPPPAPAPAAPDLPLPPADPLPGERGAGLLAARSVPLGDGGVSARLALGGLVLERRAVGVSVGYPAVSVTAGESGAALAHLRLVTWNCLGSTAPEDPAAAGCAATGVEYADLPTPALGVTRDGDALRLTGRFPTYTRPTGTPPAYTGRVYDLSVTVARAGPPRDGEAPAEGALFLGTERADSLPDPLLSRFRPAG